MDFDHLKKFKAKNHYVKDNDKPKEEKNNEKFDSFLEGPNKHLYASLLEAQREIKRLQEDIASLYAIFIGSDEKLTTKEKKYELYQKFLLDERHVRNNYNRNKEAV